MMRLGCSSHPVEVVQKQKYGTIRWDPKALRNLGSCAKDHQINFQILIKVPWLIAYDYYDFLGRREDREAPKVIDAFYPCQPQGSPPSPTAVPQHLRFKAVHSWLAVGRFNLFTTKCERPLSFEETQHFVIFCSMLWVYGD